jgi:hypothetical protein
VLASKAGLASSPPSSSPSSPDAACRVEAPSVCPVAAFSPLVDLALVFRTNDGVLFGELFTSDLSCVLLAELAVGLIIRARKPSSEPLEDVTGLLSAFLVPLGIDVPDDRAAGFAAAAATPRARDCGRLVVVVVVAAAGFDVDTEAGALDG